ncbi:succinylglutamate-semialdehyde dehydrogenase [Neptuniibacter caesariensis]|uniref:N-succinylglutamate 5-semialdehyde dehydrogenase n=1 Tax=Neptuniibacter caesariensis TaxID=207954 RepID=A0A7U8C743_NEPCE|nr:succinylglutamate-semialdehyde dehydrogenase [Neptuniibacter caesariensis]EAR62783.1 Succinylglutamic semialdehyde dehydrogenase [Oceanospirillum sp. MED92] [Neptuniibacter caesariensis]
MKPLTSLFIDGQWIQGEGESFESLNPGNGESIWEGNAANADQVDDAVAASRKAFPHWAELTLKQRAAYFQRFNTLLEEHKTLLADTIGQETGKPLWEAQTEITAMLGKASITVKAYQERCSSEDNSNQNIRSSLSYRPHGVVAIFGPYNFPGHLPNGHIMPALLAGNTVVFKPSELTPRTAELMVHLWQKAELPDGVLNLVQGGKDTGVALASHQNIDGLFFTGSAETGCYLHEQFGGHPEKILALEMGGNNPLLVTETDNIPAAVYNTIQSAYITSGQRCTCARRLLVPEGYPGDRFILALKEAVSNIGIGAYNREPQPFMGPLISQNAVSNLLNAQQTLLEGGAEALLEMQRFTDKGAFLTPGLLECSNMEDPPDQELFGPLLQIYRFKELSDAVDLANHTRYGLSAGVLSDNPAIFEYFQRHVRAGLINWNRPLTGASSARPFGGTGLSGNHRPSASAAADYCAYPVASLQSEAMELPDSLPPGLHIDDHIWSNT